MLFRFWGARTWVGGVYLPRGYTVKGGEVELKEEGGYFPTQ